MKTRNPLPAALAAFSMLLLILDSQTALQGARDGIDLCLRTVVPSLFPFFVLSGILVGNLMGAKPGPLSFPGRWLGIPQGAQSLLIPGFLGGYPVGAAAVRDAWKRGQLTDADAARILPFCNNAGPAFLFGMAAPLFSSPWAAWALWAIQIAGAFTAGILLRQEPEASPVTLPGKPVSLPDSLKSALFVTAKVSGWVILFRIVITFLRRWFLWLLPSWTQVLITGLLELANGCLSLSAIPEESLRFLLCTVFLSFGGVCVHMQTLSVTEGLYMKPYFTGKLLQCLCCLIYCGFSLQGMPLLMLLMPLLADLMKKAKKGWKSTGSYSIMNPRS